MKDHLENVDQKFPFFRIRLGKGNICTVEKKMKAEPENKQVPLIDTLAGVDEVDALNTLAWELARKEPGQSLRLAERALYLSQNGDNSQQTYRRGAALALRTIASDVLRLCDYSTALIRSLEALDLFETLDEPEAHLSVLGDLGWAYFNLGDFPRAFEILLQGLKLAREKKCLDPEVNILCSLGAIYGERGDYEASLDALQRALNYKKDAEISILQATALNNIAMIYLSMHRLDQAMDYATRCLEIIKQLDLNEMEAVCLDTLGQIAMARKEYSLAESYFKESIAYDQRIGVKDEEIWLSLGRLYIEQNRMDEAASLLMNMLESVEKKGIHRWAYRLHELLSKIYETRGDYPQALEQYRMYHEAMSRVVNEDTQRSMDNLSVLHKVETSRIDGEIYRLKNKALNREISARRMDVAHMEVLATTDALTGLYNRRHFLTLSNFSLEEAHKSHHPLTVLWMDIDNFKLVNDRHGHLAGDLVLKEVSKVIQTSLRSGDLLSRFGGEEFVALLPDTPLMAAKNVAERINKSVAASILRVDEQDIWVTLSIGAAAMLTPDEELESLLNRADQTQYAAKRAGKNRVVVDWTGNPGEV